MERKLYFLLILCAIFSISFDSNSQIKFGIRGGLNLSHGSGQAFLFAPEVIRFGYHGGLIIDIPLDDDISIQTGVNYTTKGFRRTGNFVVGDSVSTDNNIFFEQIEIPLLLKINAGDSGLRPYFLVGPYVGYLPKENRKLLKNEPLEYGGQFGMGIHFSDKIFMDGRYAYAIQAPELVGGGRFRNNVISIGLGILF
jgi:hypothetical protein